MTQSAGEHNMFTLTNKQKRVTAAVEEEGQQGLHSEGIYIHDFVQSACFYQGTAALKKTPSFEEFLSDISVRSQSLPDTSTMSPGTISLALIICTLFLSER